jgi:tRNA (guanosine-2'-O-)-methyltransferase
MNGTEASARRRLIAHLASFLTEARYRRMQEVLAERTRYITVVLEDIYQPHNASAVLRSCDGFGVQDVHIVENRNRYQVNPGVELGTSNWLTLEKYHGTTYNSTDAVRRLRGEGYRIVATSPHSGDTPLEQFDLSGGPTALLFGNELDGLTEGMLEEADEYLRIPMYGFVESFNISVSCAVILHHLRYRLRESDIDWKISAEEREQILLSWLRGSIKRWRTIEEEWRSRRDER